MNELSRCIVCLLADNDCVILPSIGGFIASYEPARYDIANKTFASPKRIIGFNSAITLNDGLLVQAYMQIHDLNYPDALRLLNKDLQNVRYNLDNNGTFCIEGLGVLFCKKNGSYQFKTSTVDIITPGLYALPGVNAETFMQSRQTIELKGVNLPNIKKSALSQNSENNTSKVYTFSMRRSFVHVIGVFVVFIVSFLCISFPLGNYSETTSHASLLYDVVYEAPQIMKSNEKGNSKLEAFENIKGTNAAKPSRVSINKSTPKQATIISVDKGDEYTIVLASDVTEKNAKNFICEIENKGFKKAEIYNTKSMRRIIYSRYGSEKEANSALRELRNHDFAYDAWVMKIK